LAGHAEIQVFCNTPPVVQHRFAAGGWLYRRTTVSTAHRQVEAVELTLHREWVWLEHSQGEGRGSYTRPGSRDREFFWFLQRAREAAAPHRHRLPFVFQKEGWQYRTTVRGSFSRFEGKEELLRGEDVLWVNWYSGGLCR
jgi:hypothetical protein